MCIGWSVHFITRTITINMLKIGTLKIITTNCPKMDQLICVMKYCVQKDLNEMANSVSPDQTAPVLTGPKMFA